MKASDSAGDEHLSVAGEKSSGSTSALVKGPDFGEDLVYQSTAVNLYSQPTVPNLKWQAWSELVFPRPDSRRYVLTINFAANVEVNKRYDFAADTTLVSAVFMNLVGGIDAFWAKEGGITFTSLPPQVDATFQFGGVSDAGGLVDVSDGVLSIKS